MTETYTQNAHWHHVFLSVLLFCTTDKLYEVVMWKVRDLDVEDIFFLIFQKQGLSLIFTRCLTITTKIFINNFYS